MEGLIYMGLITKEVEIALGVRNIKWFAERGYKTPKRKGVHSDSVFWLGAFITVKVEDLQPNSEAKICYACDGCGTKYEVGWNSYIAHVKPDGKYYCVKCANRIITIPKVMKIKIRNGNSIYSWCIINGRRDVLDRWDYELNDSPPEGINCKTKKKFYLKCPKGIHESELQDITSFIYGQEGSIKCRECLSLGFLHPESYEYWSEKNDKSPNEYYRSSRSKVWWKCENNIHEDFLRTISDSVKQEYRCSLCVAEMRESFAQQKVRVFLESFDYTILHERNCTIVPKNPKTGQLLPYDNEIVELRLIIETHGKQHYEMGNWHKQLGKSLNISEEEAFEYCKWKDNYKKEYAINSGYSFLEINWEETKSNIYKNKILDVIEKIINI